MVVHLHNGGLQPSIEPGYGLLVHKGQRGIYLPTGHGPPFHEAEGVPELVGEVAALLHELDVIEQVVAGGGREQHPGPHAIGSVLGNEVERVGRVTELLTHFAALRVAHDAGEVHVFERYFLAVFDTSHNHAGHPEKEDVRPRHQVVGGVEIVDVGIVGVFEAVEHRNWPQPR